MILVHAEAEKNSKNVVGVKEGRFNDISPRFIFGYACTIYCELVRSQ